MKSLTNKYVLISAIHAAGIKWLIPSFSIIGFTAWLLVEDCIVLYIVSKIERKVSDKLQNKA